MYNVEQNTYNLCNNEIIATVFRFVSPTFSENKKSNRRRKKIEKIEGKNIFFLHRVCAYTGQSL